jgi:hypothetical protein
MIRAGVDPIEIDDSFERGPHRGDIVAPPYPPLAVTIRAAAIASVPGGAPPENVRSANVS